MESRFNYWVEIMQKIENGFKFELRRKNGAIVVWYGMRSHRRSIGVVRVLSNYYKPSAVEQKEIEAAKDYGEALDIASVRHVVDEATRFHNVKQLADEKFETFDRFSALGEILARLHIEYLPFKEFMLGSQQIIIREYPTPDSQLLNIVTAFDNIGYNKITGQIVFIERKSSPYDRDKWRKSCNTMASLYLKEKNCKQITLSTRIFLAMAQSKGIVINPEKDIQQLLIGYNENKRSIAVWDIKYEPMTWLGGVWAHERWHDILGFLRLEFEAAASPSPKPYCQFCKANDKPLKRTKSTPVYIICDDCRKNNSCACGRMGRLRGRRTNAILCSKACPLLNSNHPYSPNKPNIIVLDDSSNSPKAESGNSLVKAIDPSLLLYGAVQLISTPQNQT